MTTHNFRRQDLETPELGGIAFEETGNIPVIVLNTGQAHDNAVATVRSLSARLSAWRQELPRR